MATARKTAEAPEDGDGPGDPSGPEDGLTKDDVRSMIREELTSFFGELEAPGPEEAGVPEKKLEAPTTQREVEDHAWESVKRALSIVDPLIKEKAEPKAAAPETAPSTVSKLRKFMWGGE